MSRRGDAPLWDAQSRFGLGWDGTGSLARNQNVAFTRICPLVRRSESLAKQLLLGFRNARADENKRNSRDQQGNAMLNLNHIKITIRDQQVLQLLMQGCSNKDIAKQLNISPR